MLNWWHGCSNLFVKVPGNTSSYFSLFRETSVSGELVELPTWQTFSKMGLVEQQIVHLGKVEDADMQPVSLASFYVVLCAFRGMDVVIEDEGVDVGPVAVALSVASPASVLAPAAGQIGQKDWHSVLKLYAGKKSFFVL